MFSYKLPSILEVDKTARLIEHKIVKTPVQLCSHLDQIATENARNTGASSCATADIQLFLKCENLQRTGSFKFRGASHFLAKLKDHELAKGVVAYSTGNHAQAVAHATQVESRERNMSIPTYVVVPSNCPAKKITAAKSYGATVLLSGTAPQDRVALANRIRQSTGAILVPSADDADIVLGQATAVRELLSQVGEVGQQLDVVIVPSGGGGLLVGAIAVCKGLGVTVFAAELAKRIGNTFGNREM
ncbi:tryptophan synthase beta subunit-like PLP-dependent enzyme [Phaeosphaeria sp. MPI-PUGE-AT-0046c]|nr:tryptophan synthase beta subunit-like PLP-dependent enzyme [Phaeosphaeria sp. MPI-PUGE-AT-0046c]